MQKATPEQKAAAESLRAIGISESYASQLARAKRTPSQSLALDIFRKTGLKLGPIAQATDAEISVLERVAARPAHAEARA